MLDIGREKNEYLPGIRGEVDRAPRYSEQAAAVCAVAIGISLGRGTMTA
jgi:hypothetical protein